MQQMSAARRSVGKGLRSSGFYLEVAGHGFPSDNTGAEGNGCLGSSAGLPCWSENNRPRN